MASAVILAMIVTMFVLPNERARAMGVFSFTASAGGSIGLILGGVITQTLGWHWSFLVNVPIGIATIAIGSRILPDSDGIGWRQGADVFGALSITLSLMLGVFAVVEVPVVGGASTYVISSAVLAVILFVAFAIRQATAKNPLVPLRLFSTRNMTASNVIQALLVMGCFGFFFVGALFLRNERHYDSLGTGLAFLPLTIAIGAFSLQWAESLTTRFGARAMLITGLALAALAMGWFAIVPMTGSYLGTMFVPMIALGVGIGVAFPPLMIFAMDGTTLEDAGAASGVLNTSAEIGASLGLAVLASVSAAFGFQITFVISTVCIGLCAFIAVAVLRLNGVGNDLTVGQLES
jgi:MFS family permease